MQRLCVADDPAFSWLFHSSLQQLFALLNHDGEEVRVVGGAVRNALLGEAVGDIDCATTMLPERVMARAEEAGLKTVPTGLAHGTVTVVIEGQGFEVTSLRADVETDGRHAVVAFGKDWVGDAYRRDFTMNALYLDADGKLYDPTGLGIEDAAQRRIRFIGDASQRIAEDYLRVLRFFRFYAHYGRDFLKDDYQACVAAQGHLSGLSKERVGAEMSKLVLGSYAGNSLRLMLQGGLLTELLHAVPHVARFERLAVLATELCIKPSLSLALASLCINVREDAVRMAQALRLSNKLRDDMSLLADNAGRVVDLNSQWLARLAYAFGPSPTRDLVLFTYVTRRVQGDVGDLCGALKFLADWQKPVFPISGRDLMALGLPAGPQIGRILAQLEEGWIAQGFSPSREQLLIFAKDMS